MENTVKFYFETEIAVAIDHFTNLSLQQENIPKNELLKLLNFAESSSAGPKRFKVLRLQLWINKFQPADSFVHNLFQIEMLVLGTYKEDSISEVERWLRHIFFRIKHF